MRIHPAICLAILGILSHNLFSQTLEPPGEPDLLLPTMILEVKDKEGPPLVGIWTPEWDVALPDAAYPLPPPAPLKDAALDNLFESPAALLPSGSSMLPADWNLLTSLGMTLGIPYRFGLDVELLRIGKNLPFRLNFSHRTLDSYWNGSGFHRPGDGYNSRNTWMNFDISQDPARSWGLNMGLQETAQGLQRKTASFYSAESRHAWIKGEYRWPLAETWFLSTDGSLDYFQKVLGGINPESAVAGEGTFNPGILWVFGDLGEAALTGKASFFSLASDVQENGSWGTGALGLDWKLYLGQGWAFSGKAQAAWELNGFLFPSSGFLSWQNEFWRWELEGSFRQGYPKNLWTTDPLNPLAIPKDPEASGQGRSSLLWKFSPVGSAKFALGYQGGWLYETAGWDVRTGQRHLVLADRHRWSTGLGGSYRLFGLWNNDLGWDLSWDDPDLGDVAHKGTWITGLTPDAQGWKVSHSLVLTYSRGWEIPRGELSFHLFPSPLVTIKTGLEDWTSLFLPSGRMLADSFYQDPGFRFYVSGQLNL